MNQVSFRDALDVDIISCEICCEKFTSLSGERVPKMLSCSHSFCSTCIELMISSSQNSPSTIMCPTCRRTTNLPKDGLSGLANNFTVLNLLDMINADIEPRLKVFDDVHIRSSDMCSNCEKNTAYFHCQQCETIFSYFCQQCAIQHNNFKVFKSHEIIAINLRTSANVDTNGRRFNPPIIQESYSQKKDICEKHVNKTKDIYCKSCQQVICDRCALSEHRCHNFADLVEYINEEKQVLKAMVDSIENYNKYISKDQYSTYFNMIQNNHHSIATQIENTFQQLQTELYQRKDQLMQQLESVAYERQQKLQTEKQCVEDWLQRCAACVPAANTLITLGDEHHQPRQSQSLLQSLASSKADLQLLWLQLASGQDGATATSTSPGSTSPPSSLFTGPWGEVSRSAVASNVAGEGPKSEGRSSTTAKVRQAPGRAAISFNECSFTLWLSPESVTELLQKIHSLGEFRDKTYPTAKLTMIRVTPLVSGASLVAAGSKSLLGHPAGHDGGFMSIDQLQRLHPPPPPPLLLPSSLGIAAPPYFQYVDSKRAADPPVRKDGGSSPRYISVKVELGLVTGSGEPVSSGGGTWTPSITLLAPPDAATTTTTTAATYLPIPASEYEVDIQDESEAIYTVLVKLLNCHSAIFAEITVLGEPIRNEPILLVHPVQLLWGEARGSVIQTGCKSQSKASVDNLRSVSKDTSWLSSQSKDFLDLKLCSEYCLLDRIEIWSRYASTYRIFVKRRGEVAWRGLRGTSVPVPVERPEQWTVRVTDSERCDLGPVEALRLECCRVPGGYVSLYSLNVFGFSMNSFSSADAST